MKSKKYIEIKVKSLYNINGGEIIIKSCRKVTTIRLPYDLNQQLKDLADKQGQTKNSIMVTALQQYIERNDKR